jgi:hypothetical protein
VEQRFSAAITGLFSSTALAAEGGRNMERDFFRSLFSRAVKPLKSLRAAVPEVGFLRSRRVFPQPVSEISVKKAPITVGV